MKTKDLLRHEDIYIHVVMGTDDGRVICKFEHPNNSITWEVINQGDYIQMRTHQRNRIYTKNLKS